MWGRMQVPACPSLSPGKVVGWWCGGDKGKVTGRNWKKQKETGKSWAVAVGVRERIGRNNTMQWISLLSGIGTGNYTCKKKVKEKERRKSSGVAQTLAWSHTGRLPSSMPRMSLGR